MTRYVLKYLSGSNAGKYLKPYDETENSVRYTFILQNAQLYTMSAEQVQQYNLEGENSSSESYVYLPVKVTLELIDEE